MVALTCLSTTLYVHCPSCILYVTVVSVATVAIYRTYFTVAGNESQYLVVAIFHCYLSYYLDI